MFFKCLLKEESYYKDKHLLTLLIPMIDEEAQKFYRKQMHRPMQRFLKRFFPLIIAASIVFGIMLTVFMVVSQLLNHSGMEIKLISHSILAVLISVSAITFCHFLFIRRQSRFQPIRIKISRKSPPFDQ